MLASAISGQFTPVCFAYSVLRLPFGVHVVDGGDEPAVFVRVVDVPDVPRAVARIAGDHRRRPLNLSVKQLFQRISDMADQPVDGGQVPREVNESELGLVAVEPAHAIATHLCGKQTIARPSDAHTTVFVATAGFKGATWDNGSTQSPAPSHSWTGGTQSV
eukprot:COSAG03_NODE_4797_length_1429_cov_2.790226_2_plen_161_part_00